MDRDAKDNKQRGKENVIFASICQIIQVSYCPTQEQYEHIQYQTKC